MRFKPREVIVALIIPILYLVIALATIGHYGISIDEPAHFRRGQAFLHFFLTGKKDYSNIPRSAHRSFYQEDNENGYFYIDTPVNQSHPPINDTLAAFTNYIFYQKLNLFDDVDAHHLFGIFSVTLLLLGVYVFTRVNFDTFTALVASLSIALYPMFLGESHFNIKDPPEASFFALTIFLFWWGFIKKNSWAILGSSLFCALALGTKFNIVFAPFILVPWLFMNDRKILRQPTSVWRAFFAYPLIVLVIFFASNPNLWMAWQGRLTEMIRFYMSISTKAGGSPDYQPQYLIWGFNTYPLLAIIYSVPVATLFLSSIGILYSLRHARDGVGRPYALLLFWFLVPIVRVTLPGTTIYGGIRHIFEFVPAMGILTGIGVKQLVHWIKVKRIHVTTFNQGFILLLFLPIIFKLISIHPNENVYFNSLIGGLKGAKERSFPSAGASLGNTYLQGAKWLNEHAEDGACVATPIGIMGNIPKPKLRRDVRYDNTCQSNLERKGEYAMDMVYNGYYNDWYAYKYYATYLTPVHEIVVDGVTIFQIFKNDVAHTRPDLVRIAKLQLSKITQDGKILLFELPQPVVLSGVTFTYDISSSCAPITDGAVLISQDGNSWKRETDAISVAHGKKNFNPLDKVIERKFAVVRGRYVRFVTDVAPNCSIIITKADVFYHPDAR